MRPDMSPSGRKRTTNMQQENNIVFAMLLEEIQQCTMNVWCIPMEVVQETDGIAKFKASRHHVWIQASKGSQEGMAQRCSTVSRERKWTG
jgi:hypothetical protein